MAKRPSWETDIKAGNNTDLDPVVPNYMPDEVEVVGTTAYISSENLLAKMHPQSRLVREAFVAEYMFDFNPRAAAIRAGFRGSVATDAAKTFLEEPVVQRMIRERMQSFNASTEITLARISAEYLKQATRTDSAASHAASVNALEKLSKLHGLGEANAPETQINLGGIMVVPAIPDADSWEAQATQSQTALKADVAS